MSGRGIQLDWCDAEGRNPRECSVSRTGELRKEKNKRDKCIASFFPSFLIHSASICCMLRAVLRLGVPWGFFMPVVHEGCSGGVCAPARLPVAYAELPKPPPWAFVGRGCRPHCRRNLPLALLGLLATGSHGSSRTDPVADHTRIT